MDKEAALRLKTLASHLESAPSKQASQTLSTLKSGAQNHYAPVLPNKRPGDEDVDAIETSYFVQDAFEPRADELTQTLDLTSAAVTIDGKVSAANLDAHQFLLQFECQRQFAARSGIILFFLKSDEHCFVFLKRYPRIWWALFSASAPTRAMTFAGSHIMFSMAMA